MKKFFTFILSALLMVSCVLLFAACTDDDSSSSETELGFVYELVQGDTEEESYLSVTGYNVSDEVAELVSQQNYSAEAVVKVSVISIPTEEVEYKKNGTVVGTYPVREIAESAFANMLFIKEVIIPANVETIGSACLAGCTNLEKLTVNFIGNKQSGNVNAAKTLGYLFGTSEVTGATSSTVNYNSSGSSTYYIPDSLATVTVTGDTVGDYAFSGFTNLQEVILEGNVTEIGRSAFYNCSSLTTFTLPTAVTKIGTNAFYGCSSLVNVGLDAATNLEYIGDTAFSGCALLCYSVNGGSYTAPATLTYIGQDAFSSCTSIAKLDLSALTSSAVVKSSAFAGCTALTSVTLPSDYSGFEYLVFADCTIEEDNVTGYTTKTGLFPFDYEA